MSIYDDPKEMSNSQVYGTCATVVIVALLGLIALVCHNDHLERMAKIQGGQKVEQGK